MAVELKEIDYNPNEGMQVNLIAGTLPVGVDAYLFALDFQEHGVRVEQHEPSGGSYVRHVTFVPYANLKSITQSYPV
jgi:hypothetical protein